MQGLPLKKVGPRAHLCKSITHPHLFCLGHLGLTAAWAWEGAWDRGSSVRWGNCLPEVH